jgi:hypothetical protein
MAQAVISERDHRASGELAYHILEAMLSFEKASRSGSHILLESSCDRPAPMSTNLKFGEVPK